MTLVTWSISASSSASSASAPGSPRGTSRTMAWLSPNSEFISSVSAPYCTPGSGLPMP